MRRRTQFLLYGLAAVAILPLLAGLWLMLFFDWNAMRQPLGQHASERLGRDVVVGDISADFGWPISSLSLRDIRVANAPDASEPGMLTVQALRIEIDLKRLLRGDVVFRRIALEAPSLLLEKNAAGEANWSFGNNPGGGVALAPLPDSRDELPVIDLLTIRDGRLRYADRATDTSLDIRTASITGSADDDARAITLEGGGLVRGQKLRIHLAGGSIAALRSTTLPYPVEGELRAGATRASFEGTVLDPFALKGFDVQLRVQGGSASDLFPLIGIALLPTPPYRLNGRLRYAEDLWTFDQFSGRMGDSDLQGTLRWDTSGTRPMLRANFESRRLSFDDLGPLIGAGKRGEDDGRVLPDLPLDPERLAAMDADVEFRGLSVVATEMPFEDFHVRFRLRDRVLRIAPLRFSSGAGAIEGFLTIDGVRTPPFIDSRWVVHEVPLAAMMERAAERLAQPNVTSGTLNGDAVLRGRGGSLRDMLAQSDGELRIEVAGGTLSHLMVELMGLDIAESAGFLLKGDAPVPIRCMLGDFAVDEGRMRPRVLVLDTSDTVVTGEGSIDLSTERVDLRLTPEPKDFSPLALRTPLTITGTLQNPAFGVVRSGLIARGVVAAALALAFPPAAIAALFEPGTGEDSHCQVLLENRDTLREED